MLLGDFGDLETSVVLSPNSHQHEKDKHDLLHVNTFGKSLDVLHAASAALIDGMRDILLQSDFENAMKVLTSWVPIQDIEVFMRVARVEWKIHSRKNF